MTVTVTRIMVVIAAIIGALREFKAERIAVPQISQRLSDPMLPSGCPGRGRTSHQLPVPN